MLSRCARAAAPLALIRRPASVLAASVAVPIRPFASLSLALGPLRLAAHTRVSTPLASASATASAIAIAIARPLAFARVSPVAVRSFSSESKEIKQSTYDFVSQPLDTFVHRHLGPSSAREVSGMCRTLGIPSLDTLIDKTVPTSIRAKRPLALGPARGEAELLAEFKGIMSKNIVTRSHIGTGYYDTITPPVILRNIMENPGWYTPYTPYQAEISQGRLEMLLNFQTMVCDLTGLPVANASLLDEATAAAEAMSMAFSQVDKKKKVFLISNDVHPQTIAVCRTRADGFGIVVKEVPHLEFDLKDDVFGVLVQYPATNGNVHSYASLTEQVHKAGASVIVAADLLALTVLTPPGEWGADVVLGSAQRFGVPLGFGGPHAAFFATKEQHKRKMPGRIIGVSKDSRGKPALRMAMQTREQHIRRDKATSNICTAQALLANMAAAYAIYHGPVGLKRIALKTHALAKIFAAGATQLGLRVKSADFFDTVHLELKGNASAFVSAAEKKKINLRHVDTNNIYISFDETTTLANVEELLQIFTGVTGGKAKLDLAALARSIDAAIPSKHARTSTFLQHPVFNMYHSETEMLRYLYTLQSRDLSLQTAMIPLGSCTMKLNGTSEMIPVTWPEVGRMHPFAPLDQTKGYTEMLTGLEKDLCEVTGFAAVSLQPNAGSQGEYAGLLAIREYHRSRGDAHRNVCLIPTSAHGTNPASAALAGMKIVAVNCDAKGNIDIAHLREQAEKNKTNLSTIMVTYPSTHGVFEDSIRELCDIVHKAGGQVYMDGANMNAQVGLCSPGEIGADVCHLNLHKTFCIPHGGGGPGMGPIGVAKHLAPFLPSHPLVRTGGATPTGAVSAAPYSSASILPISWMYLRLMGAEGLTQATKIAILNANYMAQRLRGHYDILFTGANNTVAHEFILDLRPLKAKTGISEEDIAKRLMDYNFHAPTMSFPVVGTLMVEPTESESLYELDRFCDAMISIRKEISEVESGAADRTKNVLKGAPHTADTVLSDSWDRPYRREKAAYPLPYLRTNKFWPSVGRLDNVFGDRNVICTCPPLESYTS